MASTVWGALCCNIRLANRKVTWSPGPRLVDQAIEQFFALMLLRLRACPSRKGDTRGFRRPVAVLAVGRDHRRLPGRAICRQVMDLQIPRLAFSRTGQTVLAEFAR